MNDYVMLTTILLLGIFFGAVANYSIKTIVVHVEKIQKIIENNRLFKKKQEEVDKMKAEGGMHEWVSIKVNQGVELMVCRKTGWCPTLNGFIPLKNIESALEMVKSEQEYKIFRDTRVLSIATKYNLSLETTEEIVEKIFSIKKDWTLLRLERFQKELEQRSGKNANTEAQD